MVEGSAFKKEWGQLTQKEIDELDDEHKRLLARRARDVFNKDESVQSMVIRMMAGKELIRIDDGQHP